MGAYESKFYREYVRTPVGAVIAGAGALACEAIAITGAIDPDALGLPAWASVPLAGVGVVLAGITGDAIFKYSDAPS